MYVAHQIGNYFILLNDQMDGLENVCPIELFVVVHNLVEPVVLRQVFQMCVDNFIAVESHGSAVLPEMFTLGCDAALELGD